jgi:hypothetical protein
MGAGHCAEYRFVPDCDAGELQNDDAGDRMSANMKK